LLNEIQQGLIDVVEDTTGSQLIIRGDSLYASGSADIKPTLYPLIDRIGQELAKVPGLITVTGHTDNVPGRTLRFPSNYELSVGRAQGVTDRLQQFVKDPSRIKTIGVADSKPLVPNATAEGRARNRRVEITLRNPA
jgi:type VI secretion system protein ImpK